MKIPREKNITIEPFFQVPFLRSSVYRACYCHQPVFAASALENHAKIVRKRVTIVIN